MVKSVDIRFDAQGIGVAVSACVAVRARPETEIGERAPVLDVVFTGERRQPVDGGR